jgi:glutathione S-transferase
MSTCAQKVRLAIEELGLQWESHHLKLRGDEQLQPEYLKINPKGQVPALIDGGVVVVESTVINEYLVDSREAWGLLPADAAGRARMRWWTRQTDDDVFTAVAIMSQAISFRHQYLANGPEALERILSAIPDEARRELKRMAFSTGLDNPALPMAARRMSKLFADMDAALGVGEWLAGERFTLADIAMIPFVVRMEHLAMAMMFEGRSNLDGWLARFKSRRCYAEGMVKWFNLDYLTLCAETGREAQARIRTMLAA